MFFQRVYDEGLAQASYVIGCQAKNVALVIDAQRDVDVYLEIAKKNGFKITHITETHIHADYLTGSRELAAITGAELYLSDEGGEDWQYEYPHIGLKDGSLLTLGNLTLKVIHTPGHTPESISFLLTDHPASEEPVMIFTGDFVFVGDVGRPDLLEKAAGVAGTQLAGAKEMYASIQKFASLPDFVQVWPGHGAGSACGKALGAVPSSTIGYEKIRNWAFQYPGNEKGFIDFLLEGQPEPPKYFAMMKKLNKVERPLLLEVPKVPHLTKEQFLAAYEKGVTIIDTRNKSLFEKGFIQGSINIQGNKSFTTWAGWVLNYQEQFILIAKPEDMDELTRKLIRIGLDNLYGFIADPAESELPLQQAKVISLEEFKSLKERGSVHVIDIRAEGEYQAGHIENAKHVFLGTLADNLHEVPKDEPVVIHCQAGDRAAIGYSLLANKGFTNVKNFSSGMKGWKEAGNPVVGLEIGE